MLNKLKQHKIELIILAIILIITGLAHGYNIFNYPAYFDDEGTYSSYAWSFLNTGKLSHYTYHYDHPPLGWIQIALWALVTGGFSSFGFAINSGRILMLIFSLGSIYLVYRISRNIGLGICASSIGTLLVALSPLAIAMNRMVFLDNIMVFWLLLSAYFLSKNSKKITLVVFSAFAFGIAVLSKEIALLFMPAFLIFIYQKMNKHQRVFSVLLWLFIVGSFGSLWILYALLKNEFIPPGWFLSDPNKAHVSLIETLNYQLSRGGNGTIFSPESDIRLSLIRWLTGHLSLYEGVGDPLLLITGMIAILVNLSRGIFSKVKEDLFIALFGLFYILFLLKGGVVLIFYIIVLFPILALNISLFLQTLINFSKKYTFATQLIVICIFSGLYISLNIPSLKVNLFSNQTGAQLKAISWIKANVSPSSPTVIDDYAYIDLRLAGFTDPNPIYYWKAQRDPEANRRALNNDWRNIDYMLVTPSFRSDIKLLPFIKDAYDSAEVVATYDGDNYYKIEILKVDKDLQVKRVLTNTWEGYKRDYITPEGTTTDPVTQKITSESQSYSMLRSVFMDDKQTFKNVWLWTSNNLLLQDKHLFAWLYGQKEKSTELGIRDKGTATDADQDIALALLFAYKKWGDIHYLDQAKNIINDIWKYETVEVKGKRYIVAGDWASLKGNKTYTINPSYLSPYAYRIFSEVDTDHDWVSLIDTSYEILMDCSESFFDSDGSVNIPPDWCALDKNGKVVKANNISDKSTQYSYDAIRVFWRIALDYQWNKEPKALVYFKKINLWTEEWQEKQKIYVNYTHDGKPIAETESLAHYGTQLAFFSIINSPIADQIYNQKVLSQWNKEGYWGNKDNYYDQNWAWFGTALYKNRLPNLWLTN